jgi:hypothetical protein
MTARVHDIHCPECDGAVHITSSQLNMNGTTTRRCVCMSCLHRFSVGLLLPYDVAEQPTLAYRAWCEEVIKEYGI